MNTNPRVELAARVYLCAVYALSVLVVALDMLVWRP